MKLFTTALFLPLVALTACASTPKVGGAANLAVVDATELPSPERSDIAASTRPYYVGPLDKLSIDVFGIPELAQREANCVPSPGRKVGLTCPFPRPNAKRSFFGANSGGAASSR